MNGMGEHAGACSVLLCACGAANAQSSLAVYGQLDAGMESPRSGGAGVNRLVSGDSSGSYLGFRGVEHLGCFASIPCLEVGINLEEGTLAQDGRKYGRESSVGRSDARLGTPQMGHSPTPYCMM